MVKKKPNCDEFEVLICSNYKKIKNKIIEKIFPLKLYWCTSGIKKKTIIQIRHILFSTIKPAPSLITALQIINIFPTVFWKKI